MVISKLIVSTSLLQVDKEKQQKPMYYLSKVLVRTETRYTHIKQAAVFLRVEAKKLHPYFQAHPNIILTNLPLQVAALHKLGLSERMIK